MSRPDLDSAGSVAFAKARDDRLAGRNDNDLAQAAWQLTRHKVLLTFPDNSIRCDHSIGAYSKHLIWLSRDINYRSELDFFLCEVFLCVPATNSFEVLLVLVEVVKVNVAAETACREPEIILEPVNAPYPLHVAEEHHGLGTVGCVKAVDIDVFLVRHTCEHVASVRELNLSAAFDRV